MVSCRDWADKLGLQRKPVSDDSDGTFAIFNGQRFVFNESSWTVVTVGITSASSHALLLCGDHTG